MKKTLKVHVQYAGIVSFQTAAKYDVDLEQEARQWIEAVINEPLKPVSKSQQQHNKALPVCDVDQTSPFENIYREYVCSTMQLIF